MKIVHDEIQFEESDLLDLDVTLSKLIYNALSAYRAKVIATNNVKIPSGLLRRMYPHAKGDYLPYMEERAAEHWLEILEKMESSFKDLTPPEEVNEKQRQDRLEGRILFAKYFHNLWM